VDPGSWASCFESVEGGFVEAMFFEAAAGLTPEVELGVLPSLSLLDGAFYGKRQLDAQALHVRLDFVQVFLAKVLHGVSHRIRLEHGNAVAVWLRSARCRSHPRNVRQRMGVGD